ncbi:PKD domain-containing protein, partial [Flavobacterium rakeshii]|uniref:PKD domain-containing protein n=1 Tax=Flavobacterium rakeshii TaxID=1038845 RepID=UPI002E7C47D2
MRALLHFIFISLFLVSGTNAVSQVIFQEDFDNIPGSTAGGLGTYSFPSGWTLANVDGFTPDPSVSYFNNASWIRREDFFNVQDSVAVSTSWYEPVNASDDWMWTPAINLASASYYNLQLSWGAQAPDPEFPDGYEVRIMTTPPTGSLGVMGNMLTNSDVLFSTEAENSDWTTRTVSLNSYTGQTVYIGFRNNSIDMFLLFIDDVIVEELPITPSTENVLYVNKNVVGGNKSGDSWENALPEVADALRWANDHQDPAWATTPLQIWVAGGTYTPLYSPQDGGNFGTNQDRYNSFLLVKDVQLYGGFAGTETTLSQRDLSITTNASVLSGDRGTPINNSDNTCHVVVSAGDVGSALLNGFTVTGGNASIYNEIIVNGQSLNNFAGGGIYTSNSSPGLMHLTIVENKCNFKGGGIYVIDSSSPILKNIIITGNEANYGGGMCCSASSPNLTNVTMIGNSAVGYNNGNEIYNTFSSSYNITNSIIWGQITNNGVTVSFTINSNSLIQNASNTANGNIDATGLTAEDIFTDPANGDYSLKLGSPAIDAGNNTLYTDAGGSLTNDTDLAGNQRVLDGIIDIGAYENQGIDLYPDANNVLYVNSNVSGGNGDGSSWENAIPQLADALKWAKYNQDSAWATTPLQIWVAGGTYKPLYSPEDGIDFGTDQGRNNSFLILKDVQLFGSFAGTESNLSERDLSVVGNESVLSGDIGVFNDLSDNVYHVVVSAGNVGTALLNGFQINGGNADSNANLTINGQLISHRNGGGIFLRDSSLSLTNVKISENAAILGGGMSNSDYSSPSLTNVMFSKNTAANGGGIYNNNNCTPSLTNVTISENTAYYGSGMCNFGGSSPTINNSIVWGEIINVSSYATYTHSLIQGSSNSSNGNIDATGLATEDIFTDPANGDYTLKAGSPAVNTGSNTAYTNAGGSLLNDTDVAGNARVYDDSFFESDIIDMGAYEYSSDLPVYEANFSLSPSVACSLPHTVFFTDQSEQPDTWEWDFGDGSTSTAQNPIHTYISQGEYTVTLKVTDTIFNTFDIHTDVVTIQLPTVDFTTGVPSNCTDYTLVFTDATAFSGDGSITAWEWNFGDGTTSVVQNPEHTYSTSGTYTVTLKVTTNTGCTFTKTNSVTVNNPLSGSTTVTNTSCSGSSDGAINLTVTGGAAPYTFEWSNFATTEDISNLSAGTYSVTITDDNGCTTTTSAEIINGDTIAPVADVATLADITAQCEILESDVTQPTATDNCGGLVTVTNDATFPITTQGTTVITWTYTDENGNYSTQIQNVVIEDTTAPVADVATLADITAQCEVLESDVTQPTATDNCGGLVTVTNDATFPITTQGTTVITWTYTDENGNYNIQVQNVVIEDTIAPVADVATLADITAQCEVLTTDITVPTATDNCGGVVTVTNNAVFPITTQGTTVITWTYTDENGNYSTQIQNVVIEDTTAPVADVATLADITAQCEVLTTDITVPTATDNCGGVVTVTNNAVFPITTQGTTVITWTYTDENGNYSTQIQNVVIEDTTVPVADVATLADITAQCEVLESEVTVPTATDNCGGVVTVTNDTVFPITTQGTTIISWTYTDENGNYSTQTQNVVI